MRNTAFGKMVRDRRRACCLTRRGLAEKARMDPSYVTLMERDGYVPRKDKVIEVARATRTDFNRMLLVAGYAPEGFTPKELLEALEVVRQRRGDA